MGTARKTDTANDWVSVATAQQLLGMARQTVLTRIVHGELTAQRIAGRTLVSRESVEKLIASRE